MTRTTKQKGPAKKPAVKKPARMKPKGPPVRGKRGQKTVDRQAGFDGYLRGLFLERPKLTLDQMVEKVRGTGYWISRSALARWGMEFEVQRQKARRIIELAKEFAHDDDDVILSLEKASSQLALTKLFDDLLESESVDDDAIAKMQTIARLQSSGASRERARMQHSRGVRAAQTLIKAQVQALLANRYPKLLDQVLAVIDESAHKLLEESR
jgi:hypothetical protein